MSVKKIKIMRASRNGGWDMVWITIFTETEPPEIFYTHPDLIENEDEAVSDLFNDILMDYDLEHLRSRVLQAHNRLRENDVNDRSCESTEIILEPEEREPHQSCKVNNDNVQESEENGISQSEVQQKLAHFSKPLKFFEDNKCSVCLNTYKEILDENLHIVIPSCGHPLCCGCADNIFMSTKKECPRCRGNITSDSFNLMKFNADLEIVTHNQRVFL